MAQEIVINGGVVNHAVYGNGTDPDGTPILTGYPVVKYISNNIVTIQGGAEVKNDVFGAMSVGYGEVISNKVTITNGNIAGEAYGGKSNKGIVQGNILEMTGGIINNDAFGGYGDTNALTNKLTITNGNIVGKAYGGKSNKGIVLNNILEMTGGTINKDAFGGYGDGDAISNTLNVSSGTIKGNVMGGKSLVNANNNKVIISGGEFLANVYGGKSEKGEAVGNTVKISGAPKFSSNTVIYGGHVTTNEAAKVFTGNTLNLETENPVVLKGVENFEHYNFEKVTVNAPAVLQVVDGVNLWSSKVEVKLEGEAKEGDTVTLIESQGIVSIVNSLNLYKGLVVYEYKMVEKNPNVLALVLKNSRLIPQAQVINEVASAGIVLVGQGIGFIAGRGVEEAIGAVKGKECIEV
jgi:hypothetical protein